MKIHRQFARRTRPKLGRLFNETGASVAASSIADAAGDDTLLDSYSRTIAAVVNRVAPSVLNIRVRTADGRPGSGSGFIIARDGFILTNSHVVQDARELEVTLHDARVSPARLIGTDPETDLAVIRIDAPALHHVRLANSAAIRVGQIAVAIGSPYGSPPGSLAARPVHARGIGRLMDDIIQKRGSPASRRRSSRGTTMTKIFSVPRRSMSGDGTPISEATSRLRGPAARFEDDIIVGFKGQSRHMTQIDYLSTLPGTRPPSMPEDWPKVFEHHLNASNLDAVTSLYEKDARFVARTGEIVTGRDNVREVLGALITAQTHLENRVNHEDCK